MLFMLTLITLLTIIWAGIFKIALLHLKHVQFVKSVISYSTPPPPQATADVILECPKPPEMVLEDGMG